jgi:hypothetical protein
MGNQTEIIENSEERRRALLREARRQNGFINSPINSSIGASSAWQYDTNRIPAVHPRYRASYHSLYPEEGSRTKGGLYGLYVRLVLALCLFFAFLMCDYKGISLRGVNTEQVVDAVAADANLICNILPK